MQAMALALIVALVSIGIIIPIGMWCSATIFAVIDDLDLGATGNATRTTLESNIWSAYSLGTILPIIAAAGMIIAAIIGFFAFRKGGE